MTLSLRPWTLTLLLSLLSASFIAQTHTHNGVTPCGLNHAEEMLFLRRPETRNAAIEATRALELETQQGVTAAQREEVLIIPIVFHVIHFNGPENISSAQVLSLIHI